MTLNRTFPIAILQLVLVGWLPGIHAQTPKYAFEIKNEVPLKPVLSGQFHITVDLGELPSGVKGIAHLRLLNQNDMEFPVKEMTVGCRCSSAELSVDEIKRYSSAVLDVIIETPLTSRKTETSISVMIKSKVDASRDITLVLRYQLAGLMCFVDDMVVRELKSGAEHYEFTIPFLLTKPRVATDVELKFTPDPIGVVAGLTEVDGQTVVKIVVDPVTIPDEGLTLTLRAKLLNSTLSDERTISDQVLVSLAHYRDIEISPRTLRFRRVDDRLTASCILRDNTSGGEQPVDDKLPSIEAMRGSQKLLVQCDKLGKGIFRVYVSLKVSSLTPEMLDNSECRVHWHILTSSKAFELESVSLLDVDPVLCAEAQEQ